MSMRIYKPGRLSHAPVALLLLLAACSPEAARKDTPVAGSAGAAIACRSGGESGMRPLCAVERQGDIVTLRMPAGGFRRLRIVADGRGLIAADGAAPAHVTPVPPAWIDVTVENDHYRLPANMTAAIE